MARIFRFVIKKGIIMDIEKIFEKRKIDFKQLLNYGFIKENNHYQYIQNIMNNNFQVIITINIKEQVHFQIIDLAFHEEYVNIHIKYQNGEFISTLRKELNNILLDIQKHCSTPQDFIFPQTNRISQYILHQYIVKPDFAWSNDSNSAVFRHNHNKKWFALIMNINKNKLTDEDKNIEIINLKLHAEDIEHLINKDGFYTAYHMNKKNWITIILDNTINDQEIIHYINTSYQLTFGH